MNTVNPHRQVLDLLQQGPILGKGGWVCPTFEAKIVSTDGNDVRFEQSVGLVKLCTMSLYAKACLGWNNQEISSRSNYIKPSMTTKFPGALEELAALLLDMFADQIDEPQLKHWQDRNGTEFDNTIIFINDQVEIFSQPMLEIAVEKAAIKWDERVE